MRLKKTKQKSYNDTKKLEGDKNPVPDQVTQCETPAELSHKYKFTKEIGHGSQGQIYEAVRLEDGLRVAVKQLNIYSMKNWKSYTLFHREADVLSKLNIKGVAHLYEAIECLENEKPCAWLVQEFMPGKPLSLMIKESHRFTLGKAYEIILGLLDILEKLQKNDPPVVHRDIKPSNILVDQNSEKTTVSLIDFGAVANPQLQSGGSTVAGTYGYMAPEQLMGRPVPASDIYSIGAVAVYLISGRSPADMPVRDFRLIFEPDIAHVMPSLANTLRAMLEPNVEKRLTDIKELKRRFNNFKKNRYTESESLVSSVDKSKNYDDRLKEVEYIAQDGNFDLWQELSDQTPRKIPRPLRCISPKLYEIRTNNTNFYIIKYPYWLILIVMGIISIIIMLSVDYILGGGYLSLLFPISFIVTFVLSMIVVSIQKPIYGPLFFESIDDSMKARKIERRYQSIINQLISNGRKTIATVVDVNYIPVCHVEAFLPEEGKNNLEYGYIVYDRPCFEISYRFNPPDDVRSEDLTHKVRVFDLPDLMIKPGDFLPILYDLNYKPYSGELIEVVRSMVYPFPVSSMERVDDYHFYIQQTVVESKTNFFDINHITQGDGIEENERYEDPMIEGSFMDILFGG